MSGPKADHVWITDVSPMQEGLKHTLEILKPSDCGFLGKNGEK